MALIHKSSAGSCFYMAAFWGLAGVGCLSGTCHVEAQAAVNIAEVSGVETDDVPGSAETPKASEAADAVEQPRGPLYGSRPQRAFGLPVMPFEQAIDWDDFKAAGFDPDQMTTWTALDYQRLVIWIKQSLSIEQYPRVSRIDMVAADGSFKQTPLDWALDSSHLPKADSHQTLEEVLVALDQVRAIQNEGLPELSQLYLQLMQQGYAAPDEVMVMVGFALQTLVTMDELVDKAGALAGRQIGTQTRESGWQVVGLDQSAFDQQCTQALVQAIKLVRLVGQGLGADASKHLLLHRLRDVCGHMVNQLSSDQVQGINQALENAVKYEKNALVGQKLRLIANLCDVNVR